MIGYDANIKARQDVRPICVSTDNVGYGLLIVEQHLAVGKLYRAAEVICEQAVRAGINDRLTEEDK
ncbi:hypothetical protein QP150_19930 [Sphingomonas sp. 22L2VL55-3]